MTSNPAGSSRNVFWMIVMTMIVLSFPTLPLASQMSRGRARDPGPRPNPMSTIPNPVPGLNANEVALFNESLLWVSELEGTCDTCVQQPQGVAPIDPDPTNPFSPLRLINSAGMGPVFNADQYGSSEANGTVKGFSKLSEQDKQAILDFLRSL